MYYFSIGIALFFAILWYRAGELETSMGGRGQGLLWALLSLVVSLLVFFVLRAGVAACLFGQFLLLVGIGVVRAVRDGWG